MMALHDLPYEVLQRVLSNCDLEDRLLVSLISSKWRSCFLSSANLRKYQLVIESEAQVCGLSEQFRSKVRHVRFRRTLVEYRKVSFTDQQLCTLVSSTLRHFDNVQAVDLSDCYADNSSADDYESQRAQLLLECSRAQHALSKLKALRTHDFNNWLVESCCNLRQLNVSCPDGLPPVDKFEEFLELTAKSVEVLEFPCTDFFFQQPYSALLARSVQLKRLDLGSQVTLSEAILKKLPELASANKKLEISVSVIWDIDGQPQEHIAWTHCLRGRGNIALLVACTSDFDGAADLSNFPFDCVVSLDVNLCTRSFAHFVRFLPSTMARLQRLEVNSDDAEDDWLVIVRAACNLKKLELYGNQAKSLVFDVVAQSCPLLRSLVLNDFDCSTTSDSQASSLANLHYLDLFNPINIKQFRLSTPNLRRLRVRYSISGDEENDGFPVFWQRVLDNCNLTHVSLEITLNDDVFLHWLTTLSRLRFLQVLNFGSLDEFWFDRFRGPTVSRFIEALQACPMLRYLVVPISSINDEALTAISEALSNVRVADISPGL